MVIDIYLNDDRTIKCDDLIIGKTYENETTCLRIHLTKKMFNKDFYLEFEKPDGTKFMTPKIETLNTADESYLNDEPIESFVIYFIPNSLLDIKGELKVEAVLRKDEEVWKSHTLKFNIFNSINASEEIPEKYPDFVSEAQKVIDLIELEGAGNKYLSDDGTYKEVEGSSGDYNKLENKPSINNVELSDNKTLDELGIQPKGDYASKDDIPVNTSDLNNDSGFITNYVESDPTVPNHIKSITEEDIEKWNAGGSGGTSDYNELTNKPFINQIGTDSSPIVLRKLQTGAYILNGVCTPYEGSDNYMTANNAVTFVNYFDTVTAIQIFYPPYSQVQYFEVYDDNYIYNTVYLNNLVSKEYVDSAISNSIGTALEGSY